MLGKSITAVVVFVRRLLCCRGANGQHANRTDDPQNATGEPDGFRTFASIPTELLRPVAGYLTTRDALQMCSVCVSWKISFDQWECDFFRERLQRDFGEGELIIEAFHERDFKFKQIYRAFVDRVKLFQDDDQQTAPFIRWDNPYRHIRQEGTFPFRDDSHARQKTRFALAASASDDAKSLVFIVRIGRDANNRNACARMAWQESQTVSHLTVVKSDRLVLEHGQNIQLPALTNDTCRLINQDRSFGGQMDTEKVLAVVRELSMEWSRVVVTIVDVQRCAVLSIGENTTKSYVMFRRGGPSKVFFFQGPLSPKEMYGIPPQIEVPTMTMHPSSLSWRQWAVRNGVETLPMFHSLINLFGGQSPQSSSDVFVSLGVTFASLSPSNELKRRDEMCSFLRAVMAEKCTVVQPASGNHKLAGSPTSSRPQSFR